MDWLLIILYGALMLTVLVVVHEAGHFFAARAFGVRVTEFMVGLPGPSIGFARGGTRFGITPWLLGGYARICGMDMGEEDPLLAEALAYTDRRGTIDIPHLAAGLDIDEGHASDLLLTLSGWGSITTPKGTLSSGTYLACARGAFAKGEAREVEDPDALLDEERRGTYRALSCWKRVVCLAAGPVMNLLLAVLIFILLYSVHGVYEPDNHIYQVIDGSPAAQAGLTAGDQIVAVDGVETSDWDTLVSQIGSYQAGQTVDVTYVRGGGALDTEVTLTANDDGAATMGFYADYQLVHLSVGDSLGQSFNYIGLVAEAVGKLFVPSTALETLSESSSIIGIAYEARSAASIGLLSFVLMGAALSVSLGLMNLLPLPPLDGGRLVVELVQRARRRELSMKVYGILSTVGISAVMVLFVYLLVQDVGRYVLGG